MQGLYVVVAGALEHARPQPSGRRFVLRYVPPGAVIGLVPVLDEQGALSDMRAHGDTTIILIPRHPLRALLERQPTLLFRLTTELCRRIRMFDTHIEHLALLPLRQRVAHALLSLANGYGRTSSAGIEIGLKVSQDDLAAMLSVSRQRLNAELRLLVAEGLVTARYSRITVIDHVRLAARAGDEKTPTLLCVA